MVQPPSMMQSWDTENKCMVSALKRSQDLKCLCIEITQPLFLQNDGVRLPMGKMFALTLEVK